MITCHVFWLGVAFDCSCDLPKSLLWRQVWAHFAQKLSTAVMLEKRGNLRGLTFELSGRRRQDARPRLEKMYRVPQDRAWGPAVGAPLERGVRPHSAANGGEGVFDSDLLWNFGL